MNVAKTRDEISVLKWSKLKILTVQTRAGKVIQFSKKNPGKVVKNTDNRLVIEGMEIVKRGKRDLVSVPVAEVERVWIKRVNMEKHLILLPGILIGLFVALLLGASTSVH
ncbi:MAG: hypothetical protein GY950_01955 [bacterium]|nr:hypothetical protein [bacterium]